MATATKGPMPAVFVGHGNPMNIVGHNRWTRGWAALGDAIPEPRAILPWSGLGTLVPDVHLA
jgi:aromatic ring-opening dioxygenase catalytic subunit (LigB family)